MPVAVEKDLRLSVRSRLASATLALVLACGTLAGVAGAALAPRVARADEPAATHSAEREPELSAPVAFLVDRDTGTVLLDKDADARRYPASTTKAMTALVVLERLDLDDEVTVEDVDFEHVTADSSVAGLKPGETLSVRDLLACLLLPSGNDASYVLARAAGGDWETFVDMMNEKAAELGCADTHFANPCGLHDDDHYTCARDLALVFEAALAHPAFVEIAGSATWDLPATSANPARTLETTDSLAVPESPVYMGETIEAAKTGYTGPAGRCLVASAERDGMHLLGVAMGASPEPDAEGVGAVFRDMRSLLEWGFGAWRTGDVVSVGDVVGTADVELSSEGDAVDGVATDAVLATVPRETTLADLTFEPSWGDASLQAPVEQGQPLGRATVLLGERVLGTVGVSAARAMELSIPAFVLWWLSDPLHAAVAVAAFVAVAVTVGLLASRAGRARRARASRYQIAVGVRRGMTPGAGGHRLTPPPAHGGKGAGRGGRGRHAAGRHGAQGNHRR